MAAMVSRLGRLALTALRRVGAAATFPPPPPPPPQPGDFNRNDFNASDFNTGG